MAIELAHDTQGDGPRLVLVHDTTANRDPERFLARVRKFEESL